MKYTNHQVDAITLFGGQKHPTIVSSQASSGYIFSEIHDVSVTMEFFSSSSSLLSFKSVLNKLKYRVVLLFIYLFLFVVLILFIDLYLFLQFHPLLFDFIFLYIK